MVEEHTGSGLTRYVFRKNKPLARVSSEGTFFYGTDNLGLEDSTFSFQVKAAFVLGGTFRFGTGHIELEE